MARHAKRLDWLAKARNHKRPLWIARMSDEELEAEVLRLEAELGVPQGLSSREKDEFLAEMAMQLGIIAKH